MNNTNLLQQQLRENGFAIQNDVFSIEAINRLLSIIGESGHQKNTFRSAEDLFAIRQFLKEIPAATTIIFNAEFIAFLESVAGPGYFVVKSIYFDKPPRSNWFVSFHQDLTISVDKKIELAGYGPWTVKQDQFAVQPPLPVLEDNFTVRIHLDNTTAENGALNVIPGSHRLGIVRPEKTDLSKAVSCPVPAGGIMLMKPLLLHASSRTVNNERRRVIHIEFSRLPLASGLQWAEYLSINRIPYA